MMRGGVWGPSPGPKAFLAHGLVLEVVSHIQYLPLGFSSINFSFYNIPWRAVLRVSHSFTMGFCTLLLLALSDVTQLL